MPGIRISRILILMLLLAVAAPAVFAQQTGSISGRVTATDGSALPGVTVEARSTVLPQPRVTVTSETGEYRLPLLPVGRYTITYGLAGMDTATRTVQVLLNQDADTDVALGVAGVSESITVTADATLVDADSTEVRSTVSEETINDLPVGQNYRDLIKLAPAVAYTEELVRGPSAGGSGQDNVYKFDGVNVTLPLFGTLASEAAAHDIEQISIIKGGAKAHDFNRAGGFLFDSVSKSGTSEFNGMLSHQIQNDALTSDVTTGSLAVYDRDRSWTTANIGGPVWPERLFFYGSYYRPTVADESSANAYGPVPDYEDRRNEYFGKLTFTPLASLLLNGSYRNSDRTELAASVGPREAGTAAAGNEAGLEIAIFEGSWVINNRSFATARWTDFANTTTGLPNNPLDNVQISTALGAKLDLNNLQNLGYFSVPAPDPLASAAYNQFIVPYIQQYGYDQGGTRTGGGAVGSYYQFDQNDFFREEFQATYDLTLGSTVAHDLHAGVQWNADSETLVRRSNGWGQITVPGGRTNCPSTVASCAGQPIFFQAAFQQQSLGTIPPIESEVETINVELNDTIRWYDWSFNVGAVISQDTFFGQGLSEADTISGFVADPGNRYEMYQIGFDKQIQPRLGATWAYNGSDNVYLSYARYNPAASSLPRAASWARNLAVSINAYFDATGTLIGVEPNRGSTGKLFADDLTPRTVDEYLIGTQQQLTGAWSARAYGRYRKTDHFWEDTNNNARVAFGAPDGIPRELYIPDLAAKLAQIGTGGNANSYVIAELDGAFTKHLEATLETDWRGGPTSLRGSYTFSHYYGNFDQDNTTAVNDMNTFIGSSLIADAAGRQIWNNRYGRLRGDRPH
ncbi:MAG TPA: carboxypeptidase regulatory-like domain-containing protein, partial [Thermoanaerobaculia bacterium]|nr:carboxypeptidase regulatory-like domain-containing protein [Thermoanaerobaculia bacterium]